MLLESGVLLVVAQLAVAEQNCTERCSECMNGTCVWCISGYYGRDCNKICLPNCRPWECGRRVCPYGCVSGWYGLKCNIRCDPKCKSVRCDQLVGRCYISDAECQHGMCTVGCRQFCPKDEPREETTEETSLPPEWVMIILFGALSCLGCCCCLVVKHRKSTDERTRNIAINRHIGNDIVPSNQRLLPGQQQMTNASSNRPHNHATFHGSHIDSNNVLTHPNYASSEDTFRRAEIPLPRYEDDSDPRHLDLPPSYESLFKPTAPSLNVSHSPQ